MQDFDLSGAKLCADGFFSTLRHRRHVLTAVGCAALLAACGGSDDVFNVKPAGIGALHTQRHDGGGDDLLTAGLGAAGLASAVPPTYADPLQPTAAELRRRDPDRLWRQGQVQLREGLRRRGFSAERLAAVKAMHKALYRDDLTLERARATIENLTTAYPEAQPDVALMASFLADVSPQRGIVR